jgi:hypothetical protein
MNWQEMTSYNYPVNMLEYKKKPKKSREDRIDALWCLGVAVITAALLLTMLYWIVD